MNRCCLLDYNKRLIVAAIRKEHWTIESEPNALLAVGTTKNVACQTRVQLP
jgi:hypothetical protein